MQLLVTLNLIFVIIFSHFRHGIFLFSIDKGRQNYSVWLHLWSWVWKKSGQIYSTFPSPWWL